MFARTTLTLFTLSLLAATACSDDAAREPAPHVPDASPSDPGPKPSTPDAAASQPTADAGNPADGGQHQPAPSSDAGPGLDAGDPEPNDPGPEDPDAGSPPPDDAGTPDAGGPGHDAGVPVDDRWAGCPSADSVATDPSWPLTLEIADDAVYCATFNESRTLQEELAAKMQLRLTPGSYRLPASEQAELQLPVCLSTGAERAVPSSAGSSSYTSSEFDGSVSHSLSAQATFAPLSEQLVRIRLDQSTGAGEQPGFVLDGRESGLDFDAYHSLELCQTAGADCFPDRIFDSCSYESGLLNLHEVNFDGGNVAFELRLGDSFAGTEPGAFVRASGSFAGSSFDQTDYFKLVYHPTHHHFERTFAVLFDEPIDGVCGLEVTALEPFGDDVPDQAFSVDCELKRMAELSVTHHELTRE